MLRAAEVSLFALVAASALASPGCRDRSQDPGAPDLLRLGHLPNVAHAHALTGVDSGRFAAALGGVAIERRVFNAGPALIEAAFAGEVDLAILGPVPAINAFVRSRGAAIRILSGAASGGARFIVRKDSGISAPNDLRGKKLGSPQIGNSQDIALRRWLRANGLVTAERGGDVHVYPLANADIFALMSRGELDGAWVPEPWAARLAHEANGRTFVDERDLWPNRRFPAAVLIGRTAYLDAHPEIARRFVSALREEGAWLRGHPDEARTLINAAIQRITRKQLPEPVLRESLDHLELIEDLDLGALEILAREGRELGYLPSADITGILRDAESVNGSDRTP